MLQLEKIDLSSSEIEVLEVLVRKSEFISIKDLAEIVNKPISSLESIISLLKSKNLVEIKEHKKVEYKLTRTGLDALKNGLPETRLLLILKNNKKISIENARKILGEDLDIAIGFLIKKGYIRIENEVIELIKEGEISEQSWLSKLDNLDEEKLEVLMRRGLIERKIISEKTVKALPVAEKVLEENKGKVEIGALTYEIMVSGKWRNAKFKRYNVEASPPRIYGGKKNFFREFLDFLRETLIELGFEEVESAFTETEFFNFDCLFQAQDHPAREIHDTFWLDLEAGKLPEKIWGKVMEVHERGWNYKWNPEISRRIVLRTQTTATTARTLYRMMMEKKQEIKSFTLDKVFRPDTIDQTHLPEFHQLDGLIVQRNFNFRDLLSILKEVMYRIGIYEVKFKPAYFPFTEPSVEVYVKIGNRWVETAGAGLLREEVIKPFEIKNVAGAWGMGVERLAMAFMGINDIRDLYSKDIEFLRRIRKVLNNANIKV